MKIRWPMWLMFAVQLTLLGIELLTRYDTFPRQVALAITNVIGVGAIFWVNQWLLKRGRPFSIITLVFTLGGLWLDALGNFRHFYGGYWWWDHLTHGIGGIAITSAFIDLWSGWRRGRETVISWWQATWIGLAFGQFLGAVYEVSEYLGDFWFKTHRVGLHFDTSRDLTFNLAGGLLIVLVRWLSRKRELPSR